jgi:hypothetical protein
MRANSRLVKNFTKPGRFFTDIFDGGIPGLIIGLPIVYPTPLIIN